MIFQCRQNGAINTTRDGAFLRPRTNGKCCCTTPDSDTSSSSQEVNCGCPEWILIKIRDVDVRTDPYLLGFFEPTAYEVDVFYAWAVFDESGLEGDYLVQRVGPGGGCCQYVSLFCHGGKFKVFKSHDNDFSTATQTDEFEGLAIGFNLNCGTGYQDNLVVQWNYQTNPFTGYMPNGDQAAGIYSWGSVHHYSNRPVFACYESSSESSSSSPSSHSSNSSSSSSSSSSRSSASSDSSVRSSLSSQSRSSWSSKSSNSSSSSSSKSSDSSSSKSSFSSDSSSSTQSLSSASSWGEVPGQCTGRWPSDFTNTNYPSINFWFKDGYFQICRVIGDPAEAFPDAQMPGCFSESSSSSHSSASSLTSVRSSDSSSSSPSSESSSNSSSSSRSPSSHSSQSDSTSGSADHGSGGGGGGGSDESSPSSIADMSSPSSASSESSNLNNSSQSVGGDESSSSSSGHTSLSSSSSSQSSVLDSSSSGFKDDCLEAAQPRDYAPQFTHNWQYGRYADATDTASTFTQIAADGPYQFHGNEFGTPLWSHDTTLGILNAHPGLTSGGSAVLRWTASETTMIRIVGKTARAGTGSTITKIIKNGTTLISGATPLAFDTSTAVNLGDYIDIVVNDDGDPGSDTTNVEVKIFVPCGESSSSESDGTCAAYVAYKPWRCANRYILTELQSGSTSDCFLRCCLRIKNPGESGSFTFQDVVYYYTLDGHTYSTGCVSYIVETAA